MAVRMAKLSRTKSGLWTARKVIPEDVREAYGKREEKPTWPASLTQGQARAEFGAWLLRIEETIAALRSTKGGPAVNLTQRQSLALAGLWYEELKRRYEDDPGPEIGWEEAAEAVRPDVDGEDASDAPWRITQGLRDDLAGLLRAQRLKITDGATERLLQDMAALYHGFCELMIRRARGDYGADPLSLTLPAWDAVPASRSPEPAGPTLMALFDGYVAEQQPAPATVKAWRRIIEHLTAFLGHDDANRLSADDLIRWKDHLASAPDARGNVRSAKTVRDKYLAAIKAVLSWARENRKIDANPAKEVRVRGKKQQRLRDRSFTNDEAETILRATLEAQEGRASVHLKAARRWVPWLCAYSGARVNEITQLRKQDVLQRDGVWAMNITPDAGSVKTGVARMVPLHSHLIEQGFLDFVDQAPAGPLFYNPGRYRGGSDGNPQYKKIGERLAAWVRSLGVDDPNVQPNHGWRHRFKTVARGAKMDAEARAVIPGHVPSSEGEAYGAWTLPDLAAEIERLPRYEMG